MDDVEAAGVHSNRHDRRIRVDDDDEATVAVAVELGIGIEADVGRGAQLKAANKAC